MPSLDWTVVGFLAMVGGILVQLFKGLVSDRLRQYIPLLLIGILTVVGALLALSQGREPMTGAFEGFFAGASAVGLYEGLSILPGVGRVVNGAGWIRKE